MSNNQADSLELDLDLADVSSEDEQEQNMLEIINHIASNINEHPEAITKITETMNEAMNELKQ